MLILHASIKFRRDFGFLKTKFGTSRTPKFAFLVIPVTWRSKNLPKATGCVIHKFRNKLKCEYISMNRRQIDKICMGCVKHTYLQGYDILRYHSKSSFCATIVVWPSSVTEVTHSGKHHALVFAHNFWLDHDRDIPMGWVPKCFSRLDTSTYMEHNILKIPLHLNLKPAHGRGAVIRPLSFSQIAKKPLRLAPPNLP